MNTATPAAIPFSPDAYLAGQPQATQASPLGSADAFLDAPAEVPTIDFVPDPVQADPSSGWQVVPATARCAEGYTIEDYERAAESLRQDGDEATARQAAIKAWQMRRWLVTALGNGSN